MTVSEFFSMGGFGFYIWSSFAATLLLVLIEVVLIKRQHSVELRRLKRISRLNREN